MTTLSIKNVPDEMVARLRRRAAAHHRSLQGELMAILEVSTREEPALTPRELLARIRASGLNTPADSAAMVREDRDRR